MMSQTWTPLIDLTGISVEFLNYIEINIIDLEAIELIRTERCKMQVRHRDGQVFCVGHLLL